jgi:V/A-type H+/Na+-transporting ATPase subunit E
MNGIDYTVKKVSDEALNEVVQNLAQGKSSALSIVERKMREAMDEAQKIADHEQRQAEALKRQIIGGAEMTARNKSLEIVEGNLNSAFALATQKLEASTSSPEYKAVLKRMALEGLDQVGGDKFVVTGNSRDQSLLQQVIDEIMRERKGVKIERGSSRAAKSIGGVIVSSGDGYVTFDNTYEARMERLKPALRKQIAEIYSKGE